nr:retrotransposon Orf1 [Tanacetum cinerariifolium]
MGYEHLSTTPETKLDEVTESSAKNLLPISSECEVTLEDEKSLPDEDVPTEEFKVYSNPLFEDDEINSDEIDPHCFNAESDFIESLLNRDTFIDSSPKFDFLLKEFSGELAHINPKIKEADFDFEEEILQDNDSQREEIDIVFGTDELLPLSFENDDYDPGEIDVVEELLVDNSISNSENELSDNEASDFGNPSFPRPPPEPPNDEFEPDYGEVSSAVMNTIDELNKDDPGEEFNIFTNVEDDDYFSFMFVIRIFLPYLIYPEVSLLLLSAYIIAKHQRDTPLLERKDIIVVGNLGSNKDDEGIEWSGVEEPLDLVNTSEESVYESLIKEMPKCSLNYYFRIKKGDLRNLKIPCMIGHKFTANAYINVELPMNIMSLAYYNSIRKNGYEYRGRMFVGLGRNMHVFVGNMSYVIDFTILENIETNIDSSLSHVIFGRPFIEIAYLAINRKYGLMTFTDETKEVTFKTPYKDPEWSELSSEGHD